MGSPAGRKTRWGEGGRATAARAARSEAEGQHEWGAGVAAATEGQHELSGGCGRRNGEPARRKQRPFPPRGGKTTV